MTKKKFPQVILRFVSIILLIAAFLGLLGAFGFSGPGKAVFGGFQLLLGSFAALGPFVLFVLSLLTWFMAKGRPERETDWEEEEEEIAERVYRDELRKHSDNINKGNQRSRTKINRAEFDHLDEILSNKGVPLPATKLVSLKGFDQYFTSDEWAEVKEPAQPMDLTEMGKSFPTYFGEGEKPLVRFTQKIDSLQGMKDYFLTVDTEVKDEIGNEDRPIRESFKEEKLFVSPEAPRWNGHELFSDRIYWEGRQAEKPFSPPQYVEPVEPELSIEDTIPLREVESPLPEESAGPGKWTAWIEEREKIQAEAVEAGKKRIDDETKAALETAAAAEVLAANTAPVIPAAEISPSDLQIPCVSEHKITNPSAADRDADRNKEIRENLMPILPMPEASGSHGHERVKTGPVHWDLPEFALLEPVPPVAPMTESNTAQQLENVLQDFGVKAKVIRVARGPVITRYELAPAPGVKISKIVNLSDDIALALAARDVRIEAPIPGKSAIGIEVPNKQPRAVVFREVLETQAFRQSPSKLRIALGKDIADQAMIGDLAKMPHLLVAGATGSGKSVCITSLINSFLFNATPDEVKFLMIDPKMVELNLYNGIPHLLAPVVTDPKKASAALRWIVKEMENRYELFAGAGVRDIERYNALKEKTDPEGRPALPLIVVIIDELADLMLVAAGEVEESVCRLAQMARAAGIHLVIATQRPSVDVITGLIKANIPSRISFAVTSQIDSRTILDATGAEKLLGRGDMLYSPQGLNKPVRVQGCLVTDDEVNRVIQHWKGQGKPEYLDPEHLFAESSAKNEDNSTMDDELFVDAGRLLITTKMASTSFLQRRMKLGYSRAARLIDMLEEQGVVGPYEGSKPRQVLLTIEEFEERFG